MRDEKLRPSARRPRRLAVAALFVLSLVTFAQPGSRAGADNTVTQQPTAVTLAGDGSFDPYQEQIPWNSDLRAAGIDPGYVPLSGHVGREELISGVTDYAISGVPFSSDELAQVHGGSSAFVSAPVFVSALAVLSVPPPNGYGINHYNCDPSTTDCQLAIANGTTVPTFTPYTGPFNFPPSAMAATMLLTSLSDLNPNHQTFGRLDEWDNPDVLNASGIKLGTDDAFSPSYEEGDQQSLLQPVTYFQSGAAEQNYYAQLYASVAAPQQWTAIEQYAEGIFNANQAPTPVDITDTLPGKVPYGGFSKEGLRQAVQVLETASNAMSLVSPSALYQYQTDPSVYHLGGTAAQWIGAENASGQYVDPSPASIDAAVNAGADAPLYALTHPVGGDPAYPLTYVDRLYAPATGLSQEKTEAIATMIRYLATAGQEYDAKYGDGRLSASLVTEALDSANHLVLSNCTGSGETVVASSDPGLYMPKLPAGSAGAQNIAGIGGMLHCDPVAPPPVTSTTTTVASKSGSGSAGTNSSGSGSSAGPGYSGLGRLPNVTSGASSPLSGAQGAASAPAGVAGTSPSTARRSNGPITLAGLPLPVPFSGGPPFDRLAGFVLGAGLLLLLRRPLSRLIGSGRS